MLIAYIIHKSFLNMSTSNLDWFINNCYTIIWFLAVSVARYNADEESPTCDRHATDTYRSAVKVALYDDLKGPSTSNWRDQTMLLLLETLYMASYYLAKLSKLSLNY